LEKFELKCKIESPALHWLKKDYFEFADECLYLSSHWNGKSVAYYFYLWKNKNNQFFTFQCFIELKATFNSMKTLENTIKNVMKLNKYRLTLLISLKGLNLNNRG